jgi:hypothetical protein
MIASVLGVAKGRLMYDMQIEQGRVSRDTGRAHRICADRAILSHLMVFSSPCAWDRDNRPTSLTGLLSQLASRQNGSDLLEIDAGMLNAWPEKPSLHPGYKAYIDWEMYPLLA